MTDESAPTRNDRIARERRGRSRGAKLFLRDLAVIVVAALVISFLIKTFLIRSFYIPSESMMNTLHKDDRIIVNQLSPELMPLSRGDVVVFRDPGGWLVDAPDAQQNPLAAGVEWFLSLVGLSAPDSNDHLIKRVIGLPGDEVACCDAFGHLTVNGVPIEEPYVMLPQGVSRVSAEDFSITVPEDAIWVMGDNRYASADSRAHQDGPGGGAVPIGNVVGRAMVISWPVSRWSVLDNYPAVFFDTDRAGP